MGAIQFIENLDKTSLTISDAEFEINVETAISAIAERHIEKAPLSAFDLASEPSESREEEMITRNLMEPDDSLGSSPDSLVIGKGSDGSISVNELLRTVQKPLTGMERIFSDESTSLHEMKSNQLEGHSRVGSPAFSGPSLALFQPPGKTSDGGRVIHGRRSLANTKDTLSIEQDISDTLTGQISSEMEQLRRHQREEYNNVVELVSLKFEPKWANEIS
jgi:Rab5 GDP/GTP exchange factor